jgi:hypothetical protein
MQQNDIYWNLQNFIFWKNKIDYKKIIMSTQNNLIIIIGSAKQHETQIKRGWLHMYGWCIQITT